MRDENAYGRTTSKILQLLDQKSVVKSQELAKLVQCFRIHNPPRFTKLEDANLLERIHSGAKRILNLGFEQNMTEKSIKTRTKSKRWLL